MNKFNDREKSFENKFAHDQELQFKVFARRNKYLAEWVSKKIGKNENETNNYIKELIKADFEEPGDQDIIRKIKKDFEENKLSFDSSELEKEMQSSLERAKKDLL